MPLQSSGIIVVDKTPIIAATASGTITTTTATVNTTCRPNPPQGLGGGGTIIGLHPQYLKQQRNFHEWNDNDTAIIKQSVSTISNNSNSNLMRRHQRTISSSSTASSCSTSSQNTKALTLANQNFNQMNQQHQHTAVLQATASNHQNPVLVSEDFIEHAGFASSANATTANVINLGANDLINQTQIIKLVSDGNGGNVLIDSLGNVTTTNGGPHHHGNSKLIVSNLAVLSKQHTSAAGQQQQTINFVNAKNLPYLTTKNQSNTTAVQKIVNIPLKATNNLVKSSVSSQIHHHHITSAPNLSNNGTPVMQKVTMPRNVQVVTRLQNITPSSQHHQQQQRHQQISQQTNVLINQMIVQEKDVHNIGGGSLKINNTGTTYKKQAINSSMKISPQQKLNSQCTTQQSVKTFVHQPHQQYQTVSAQQVPSVKQIKSQKVVRQFSNNNTNNNSSVTLTMQQHHPRQSINTTGTYTINNNKINNVPIQQNSSTTTKLIGSNSVKNSNSGTKYLMQNHIVLPSGSTNPPSTNQNINNKITNNSNQGVTNNIVVQQQIINTINNSVCGSINATTGSGTIKFVNAHGAIVQSQQNQQSTGIQQSIHHQQQSHVQKVKNNNIHHHNQTQFIEGGKSVSIDNNNIYLSTFVNSATSTNINTGNTQNSNTEDIMIVNGTQMTDELSARILQSMSQKSVYNNNQRQQHQQQQHQKIITPTVSAITTPQTNIILSSPIPREYPVYSTFHNAQHQQVQHQQHQRQTLNTQVNRSQSLDRKHIETTTPNLKRSSSEFFKVNTNEIHSNHSTTTTFIDNIPLPCPPKRGDNTPATQQAEHEDDIIGEEVRPVPVSTHDSRLQALHAILQDHTYFAPMPTRLPLEVQSGNTTIIGGINNIGAITSISNGVYTSGGCIMGQNAGTLTNVSSGGITQLQTSIGTTLGTITSSGGISSVIGYPYGQNVHRQQNDDDANSVISNESRTGNGLDNDLGEETETAPEAEAEDDSVTRCICDLTHDDGYMICCDKCSAWQHVDCMGIDRQNIPDEYLCEICQPRQVDRVRARSLQLMKRKEQTQLLMNAQLNASNSAGVLMATDANGQLIPSNHQSDRTQPLSVNTGHVNSVMGKKGKIIPKKKEILKKSKKDRANGKRRESKRTAKRKSKSNANNNECNSADKYTSNLRQWIENYEVAVTNHYSPELRARLHAISKQQNLLQQITATENKLLKSCGNLENKCTTVPHAGGKILISNLNIQPNSPIIELRGKYMLTTQYRNQNPSVNMNTPSTNCVQQNMKNLKTPGPFIFFYQLSMDGNAGPEICVDTRTYGNEARFVRRSCRPNAEIQHSFEKGTIHLYLVSLTNIMASTEITIRHEPHDLIALENKGFNFPIAPTSTICACGLTKDCAFGGNPVVNIKTNRKAIMNGCINEGKPLANKKNSQNISRGRSTSSSGESNAGLLSPNNNNTFTPNLYNSASISSLLHDSGVYTSSSSPSVSIPSPTHTQAISSPPQQLQQMQPLQQPLQDHQSHQEPGHATLLQTQEPLITTTTVPQVQNIASGIALPAKSIQKPTAQSRKTSAKQTRNNISEDNIQPNNSTQSQSEEKRESRKLTREERKMEAIVKAFEKMEKNEQRKQELMQARTSSTSSNAAKRRNSNSPSPKRLKTQTVNETSGESTNNTTTTSQPNVRKNSGSTTTRKKKRKGSKSYHNQSAVQRKRRRSRINSNESDVVTSEESTSLLSPPIISGGSTICAPPPVPQQQEVVERKMTLVNDLIESQMAESSETDSNINQAAGLLIALSSNEKSENQSINKEQSPLQSSNMIESDILKSPVRVLQEIPEQKTPQTPQSSEISQIPQTPPTPQTPPVVSSTCLLVEAAVGPLEGFEGLSSNDFKLPAKAKTKKSIMNEWLNQSNDFQQDFSQTGMEEEILIERQIQNPDSPMAHPEIQHQFAGKSLETLVQAAATICEYRRTSSSPAAFMTTPTHDEPQNLSIVAKKVEEFIHQTDANFICGEESIIKLDSSSDQSLNALSLPLQSLNCNANSSGSSSVKKRWLRQAISEETDEIAAAALSASSPTQSGPVPNGFTTPLKKRRVIMRQCNEEGLGTSYLDNQDEYPLHLNKRDSDYSFGNGDTTPTKSEFVDYEETESIKQQVMEVDDEVDIMTSPQADEKIMAEDNLVKIEPEDESKEIKVDVEKEESSSEAIRKVDNLEEVKEECIENDLEEPVKHEIGISIKQSEKKVKEEVIIPSHVSNSISTENHSSQSKSTARIKEESGNYESVSDEIADIQKRLHWFHKENIEMLQSRNRKSKIARSLKLGLSKLEKGNNENNQMKSEKNEILRKCEDTKKEELVPKYRNSKKKHLNFDIFEKEHKRKSETRKKIQNPAMNSIKRDEKRILDDITKEVKVRQEDIKTEKVEDEKSIKLEVIKVNNDIRTKVEPILIQDELQTVDEKQLQAALTIPNFNHNVITTGIIPVGAVSSYVVNPNISFDVSPLLLAPPPPPPTTPPPVTVQSLLSAGHNLNSVIPHGTALVQPPPLHLPYYNTIYGKLIDKGINSSTSSMSSSTSLTTSNLLLSDYLDTKAKSYNTLGGYVSHSALFGLNSTKSTVGSTTNSTNGTGTSNSTLDSNSSATTSNSTKSCTKIMTKTASADPRLNPILTAPEPPPAPKRKLSINEYRKRKQQSSESSTNGILQSETDSKCGPNNITNTTGAISTTVCGNIDSGDNTETRSSSESESDKMVETVKVQFSPTPTLLEQQQEILCERLKSLKNKNSSCTETTLGVSSLSSLATDNITSPDRYGTCLSSSVSKLYSSSSSSMNGHNNLDCSNNFIKGNFDNSKRRSVSTSSLESISSLPSPISSKESTPERATTPPLPLKYIDDKLLRKCDDSRTNLRNLTQKTEDKVVSDTEHYNDIKVSR